MDIDEIRNWYDGYSFEEVPSVYSPKSVISCMRLGRLGNYWNQTETFEALQLYTEYVKSQNAPVEFPLQPVFPDPARLPVAYPLSS